MWKRSLLLACLLPSALAFADTFRLAEVRSLVEASPDRLKPDTIAFADRRAEEAADPATGLIAFDDWGRVAPIEKQFLSLYPGYAEPTVNKTVEGVTKPVKEKLQMYVAEARFVVPKPPQEVDLARLATLGSLEKLDPAIKEVPLAPGEADAGANGSAGRRWCAESTLCIKSHYALEGKLPSGIHLVNQLTESKKKIADYLEFESELRVLAPPNVDQAGLARLSTLDAPVTGVLEQSIFHVNQVMQFGKFLVVLQQDPAGPNRTVATAFIALAIKSHVLEQRKKYENVPVLRNIVPAQVLMGRSSFNTGSSISAGLPVYARNRVRVFADMLARGDGKVAN
jgi:hypothetical protein